MTKLIASLGALLVFVCLGAASAGGDIRQEPLRASAPLGGEAHARVDIEEVAVAQATSDSTASVPMGGMSQKEKERRREVCANEYTACYDWCSRSNKTPEKQRPCYDDCSKKNTECMKKIPN
jgi:hypothetical protein